MQDGQDPNTPGQVIRPGEPAQATAELPPVISESPAAPAPAAEAPRPVKAPLAEFAPQLVQDAPAQAPAPAALTTEPAESAAPAQNIPVDGSDYPHIEWTASEYVANPKTAGWYGLLAVGSIILAIVVYFLSRDVIPTVVIAVLGIIVGIFAARQPHTLTYRIDHQGLHIGTKFYPYSSFKAFSVAHEHAMGFISLLPLRRFMPPLVVHYAPEDESHIAEVISNYLPYEEHKPDLVDSITRSIRF